MVGFRTPGSCLPFICNFRPDIDADASNVSTNSNMEPLGLRPAERSFSYSVSGTTGALGGVLFLETHRLWVPSSKFSPQSLSCDKALFTRGPGVSGRQGSLVLHPAKNIFLNRPPGLPFLGTLSKYPVIIGNLDVTGGSLGGQPPA